MTTETGRAMDLVAKLRKMKALSQSTNENEAAVAAAKLQELMTRYRIAELELAIPEENVFVKTEYQFSGLGTWRLHLLNTVAQVNGARLVTTGSVGKLRKVAVVGREQIVPMVIDTFEYLVSEIERLGAEGWRTVGRYSGEGSSRWRVGFYAGAASVIRQRLRETYASVTAETVTGTSLIRRDDIEAGEALARFFPRLGVARRSSGSSSVAGFGAGREAGGSVGLGRPGRLTGRLGITSGR